MNKLSKSTNHTSNQESPSVAQSHTDALLEVMQKLSLARDLETIMFIVRKSARKLTGADGATFVLKDGNKCFYAAEDAIAPLWEGKKFPMSICVSGWVMQNRKPIVIEDIYVDDRVPIDAYRPTFVKSLAMVPIRTLEPIGAIGTYWADKYLPTEEQLSLLMALADSTSVAMENIHLHSELVQGAKETSAQVEITRRLMEANRELEFTLGELNHRNKEMQWLKEFSSKLQTCVNTDEVYKLISQYANELLPKVAGILYIMHPSRNYLESMVSWGEPLLEEKIIKPEDCLALRRGSVYKMNDPQKELVCTHYTVKKNKRPYLCIPLYAQSDIVGLFYLEWKEYKNDTPEEINKKNNQDTLASMIGEQIAIGISNIKLRETLRHQSVRDPLTGLYNRRYLEETLERELSRCARKSASLAVLMIDIDHFKQFNDEYGHDAGDLVIQAFAQVLTSSVRKYDIACRYGGEEFVLIIPEIKKEDAFKRAQELHEEVRKIHLKHHNVNLSQITISIGLAMYPEHGDNLVHLIDTADKALYEAKNSGRNKTVVFEKPKKN